MCPGGQGLPNPNLEHKVVWKISINVFPEQYQQSIDENTIESNDIISLSIDRRV